MSLGQFLYIGSNFWVIYACSLNKLAAAGLVWGSSTLPFSPFPPAHQASLQAHRQNFFT